MAKRTWRWYFRELNEDNIQLLINFKKALLYRDISDNTIFEYQKDVRNLMKYLQKLNIRTLDVTSRDIRGYLDTLDVSAPRKIRIICVLNIFYTHNAKKRYCTNPMEDIDTSDLREQIKRNDDSDRENS